MDGDAARHYCVGVGPARAAGMPPVTSCDAVPQPWAIAGRRGMSTLSLVAEASADTTRVLRRSSCPRLSMTASAETQPMARYAPWFIEMCRPCIGRIPDDAEQDDTDRSAFTGITMRRVVDDGARRVRHQSSSASAERSSSGRTTIRARRPAAICWCHWRRLVP